MGGAGTADDRDHRIRYCYRIIGGTEERSYQVVDISDFLGEPEEKRVEPVVTIRDFVERYNCDDSTIRRVIARNNAEFSRARINGKFMIVFNEAQARELARIMAGEGY